FRILSDPDDATEATQETYVKVWRSLGGFRGEAMFTTWLYRVATNAAISRLRRRSRRRERETGVEEEVLAQIPSGQSVEEAAENRIAVETLEEGLRTLPAHYREAVVLRDVYGMSIEEIASRLRISEAAAKVRVHRGRKKLRDA